MKKDRTDGESMDELHLSESDLNQVLILI